MDTFDVAIVGLGFTGLPMAVAAAEAGLRVAGVDSSARRVEDITAVAPGCGLTTVSEASVAGLIAKGLLEVSQGDSPPAAQTYVLCVPTPPGSDGGADLASLLRAVDAVAERLRRDDLVLVQSTCPPGVVERVLASRLTRVSGLAPGSGFGLAYSPVRITPGTDSSDLRTLPRIVAGVTSQCRERAMRFLRPFTSELVPVSCVLVAELAKIFENTFRLVNISLTNELAALCREACVDPDEVLGAAETKPFGFLRHQPSPGAGGSCIPVAAAFFAAASRRHGVAAEVVEAAVALNSAMPARTIHLAKQVLAANGLPQLENCRVLMIGVTYKPDVAHTGFSSAVRILEELRLDAEVSYHDPYVPRLVLGDGTTLHSRPIEPDIADVVLLLTKHGRVDSTALDRCGAPIVDCTTGIPRLLATYPAKAG